MNAAFVLAIFALGIACVPGLLWWYLWFAVGIGAMKTLIDVILVVVVWPAGCWAWVALAYVAVTSLFSHKDRWPKWVKLGLLVGVAIVLGGWTYSGAFRLPLTFSSALAFFAMGGASLILGFICYVSNLSGQRRRKHNEL